MPTAAQPGDEIPALLLLASLGRRDVAAFAAGPAGAWTRLVAPRLGAPVVYGALGEVPGAPGQISIERLRRDYGLPELPRIEALFGIVGNPVTHSLSPRIHNTAYRALGIPAVYLPFHAASFGDFWLEVMENGALEAIGLPVRGLSVTAPFKESALAVCGAESPLVDLIGAANTLVWNQGVWEAEATDPDGVVLPLRDRGLDLERMAAAVVGAGGAGRSAAAGLARAGARVTMFNRDPERGRSSADHLSSNQIGRFPAALRSRPLPLRSAGQRHLARPRRGRSPAVRRRAAALRRGGDRPRLSDGPADAPAGGGGGARRGGDRRPGGAGGSGPRAVPADDRPRPAAGPRPPGRRAGGGIS